MPGVGNPRLLREATAMANTMRQHYPGLVILPAHDPGAPNIIAYSAVPDDPAALNPQASDGEVAGSQTYRSFGSARATGPDGAAAAWLQTGESYAFTAAASIRAVEETFTRSLRGAFSPAAAFGDDFAFTIQNITRIETIPAEAPPFAGYPG